MMPEKTPEKLEKKYPKTADELIKNDKSLDLTSDDFYERCKKAEDLELPAEYAKNPKIVIVVPCYNEEETLRYSVTRLNELLTAWVADGQISPESSICLVNDGSKDRTLELIKELSREYEAVTGISLAKNSGHQNALLAGLFSNLEEADCQITIDADLQDDPEVILTMVSEYKRGVDIVYGVRNDRSTDSFFKRFTAESYYKLMGKMGVDLVFNHADFRLMSKRAIKALGKYEERNIFLRGIVPLIGLPTSKVEYKRAAREYGETKYPLKKMLSFAFSGITGFSTGLLHLVTGGGAVIVIISLIVAVYSLLRKAFGYTVTGWTSLMLSLWFLGGLLMLSMGIVGEYIGKIYIESKKRPRYFIAEKIKINEKEPAVKQTGEKYKE